VGDVQVGGDSFKKVLGGKGVFSHRSVVGYVDSMCKVEACWDASKRGKKNRKRADC